MAAIKYCTNTACNRATGSGGDVCSVCGSPVGDFDPPIRNSPRFIETCEHTGVRTPVESACDGSIAIVCTECGKEI